MDPLTRARSRLWILPVIVLVAMGLLVWWVSTLMHNAGPVRKYEPPHITQVMLPPPPPPPPPPPKPEPPKEQKLVETKPFEALKPQPQKAPQPDSALTAPAGPGANNFGLQAGDGSGTQIGGKGGGGSPFAGYAFVVQQMVQQTLQRDEDTRKGHYSAVVALWIAADGTIARSQIITSAGKPELDAAITHALQGASLQPPPADMPQPINLRIGAIAPG
jgi:periplasmic protein TonB